MCGSFILANLHLVFLIIFVCIAESSANLQLNCLLLAIVIFWLFQSSTSKGFRIIPSYF